jgi:hypothetical protein
VCGTTPLPNGTVCAGSDPTTSICCNGTCWDGCCDATGDPGDCRVFATSNPTFNGALNGLTGADAICQQRADAAGLPGGDVPGTYKAWLSTGTGPDQSPATGRFRQSGQPYRRVDGPIIATNWADLIDGPLAGPINADENGNEAPFGGVWTNTAPDGTERTPDPHSCGDWQVGNSSLFGRIGIDNQTNSQWTDFGELRPCSGSARLYCFQQE